MKTALLVITSIVLVGCAAGLMITYQSLGVTKDTLEETKAALYKTQVKQLETVASLEDTQNELQAITKILEETTRDLLNQKNQTESYMQLYESTLEEMQGVEEKLDTVNGELASSQQSNRELQEAIDEIQGKLNLYEDTLGTQVSSGLIPPYRSGNLDIITLVNQGTANNPTWNELLVFLYEDTTDKNLYVPDVYVCGGFAQDLHNNAEAMGIRAAFVVVHFYDENIDSHALNAFKTVDEGLVYIDDTGWEYPFDIVNYDRTVEIAKDEPYVESLLFPEGWTLVPGENIVKSIEIYW